MRNSIDVDVKNDAIDLVCNVSGETTESCINFIVGHDITVTLTRDGAATISDVQSVGGVACYMLDDACLRCAGEFTVETDGVTPLRFIVENDIPADNDYSIRHVGGVFKVCTGANGSDGNAGMYAFHVDESGHLICTYDTTKPPPLSIDENGHLIYTIGG